MEPEQLSQFKESLEERLRELLGEADKTVSGMSDTLDTFPDPTDRASLETDRNFMLRIRDRERKLISKIKEALERIEDGTYGYCEACGEPIGEKRLQARPVTTLCIECKSRQEKQERVRGS
ncbi:MAG: RNA polymerase-binding protein DksA [Deltaproteobacteria bacterium]|nr:RNA polymerase-binding protein DksA [Deltaproteobacteria bacterium]